MEHVVRVFVGLLLAALPAATMAAEPIPANDASQDWRLLQPFWNSATVFGEGLFFLQEDEGQPAFAHLLLVPQEVSLLRSADHKTVYEAGKDYTWKTGARRIELTKNSRIPFRRKAELYPAAGRPNSIGHKTGQPGVNLLFGEGHFYHDQQCQVDYTVTPGGWQGYIPAFAGQSLPNTMAALKDKRRLVVCLSGDSISEGYNASGFAKIDVAPQQPCYGELVARGLRQVYGGEVVFHNFAVAGWSAGQGAKTAPKVAEVGPQLVIIAYGMNDVGGRNPRGYRENIQSIITTVRAANPKAEFILVASMLGNPEWQNTPMEMFPKYRDALAELCGPGVVLADMTALWTDVLKLKRYHDLTGNGVNHPNDFGHRLYAQTILALLNGGEKTP